MPEPRQLRGWATEPGDGRAQDPAAMVPPTAAAPASVSPRRASAGRSTPAHPSREAPRAGVDPCSSPQLSRERAAAGMPCPETGAVPDRAAAPVRARPNSPAGGASASSQVTSVPPDRSRTAVTRLASLPPWPAPPDPGDVLLQIRLGLPPVTESRARISPAEYTWIGGRKVKTKKAHGYKEQALADYQETVGWLLRQCRVTRNDTHELGVYGVFHLPPKAGAADGDNLLKAITDAGNGIAWKDDRQFTLWLARVVRDSADPHTDLVVYVVPDTGGAA